MRMWEKDGQIFCLIIDRGTKGKVGRMEGGIWYQVYNVFLFRIFGENQNDTFSDSSEHGESEDQCNVCIDTCMAAIFEFQNGTHKIQNLKNFLHLDMEEQACPDIYI